MAKSAKTKPAPLEVDDDAENDVPAKAIEVRIFKMKNEHQSKMRPRGIDKLMVDSIPVNHQLTKGWSYTKDGAFAGKPETDIKKSDDVIKARQIAEAAVAAAEEAARAANARVKALQLE
jgi:hypothetical protein